MGEFPSGQRGQTVNLLAMPSVVRIHLPPPEKSTRKRAFFNDIRLRRVILLRSCIRLRSSDIASQLYSACDRVKERIEYHTCRKANRSHRAKRERSLDCSSVRIHRPKPQIDRFRTRLTRGAPHDNLGFYCHNRIATQRKHQPAPLELAGAFVILRCSAARHSRSDPPWPSQAQMSGTAKASISMNAKPQYSA